ncbi:MAG TPA: BTAD domain-containing putative transcriptional regulator [Solirubrobacterales bacterium]|nr:BTAD domain-containing putative transcriptional regulator [Solirubrobacterales bacterium]
MVDGKLVADDVWRLRKAKTLIKLLALAPDRRLHADQAAAALWPDRDQAATRNNLHQAIYAARRALDCGDGRGRDLLELSDDLITLGPHDPVRIDADVFERAAARARAEQDPTTYRAALAVYEGELLPEDRYEEWTTSRRDALRELRLALGIELAELEAPVEPSAAIGRLREVLIEAPLHEPAHRALMRLLAGAGRRQEALAQFQELKRGLRREFEDEPDDETRALYREILTRSFGPEPGSPQPSAAAAEPDSEPLGRLPRQLTTFIGRERELAEATALLRGARLLTLTGAGGCGKTRLALELTRQQGEEPAREIWVVELAAVANPELVGSAIAGALGTRIASGRAPELALAEHIGERQVLLVLDNCEHLIEAVAHLAEALLARCPQLVILATSREPLRVPGELTWRVPSLSLPRMGDDPSAEDSLRAEAVRLFADRATRAAPGFEVDADNAAAVAALCHRLDGMPLAIELAAARVAVLTPSQIVARLDDSLDLLSAGSRTAMTRQQTLRATLTWSFDLLDEDEQVLLRRLAVFAGSFGIDAVEAIWAGEPGGRSEAVAVFGCLIEKSLVQVEEEGSEGAASRRYFQLDTVRQFAAEKLDAAGERADFERRHRVWYVELAGDDPTPAGELPAREQLARLDLERDNLRAALASALADDPQMGLGLAVSLWRYWMMRGYLAEAYRWLAELLEAAPEPTALRARALLGISLIGVRRGVYERLEEYAAESVATFAELGDQGGKMDAVEAWGGYRVIVGGEVEIEALVGEHEGLRVDDLPAARPAAWAAQVRGVSAWLRRDLPLARRDLETVVERLGELRGERRPALWPLSYGFISAEEEFGYPFLLQEDTVLVARRVGAEAAIAYTFINLAAVARAEGELARAGDLAEEGLAVFRHLGDPHGEASALNTLGNLARAGGDSELSQELLGRSLALRVETGDRRGNGITLLCLALTQARAGDTAGARAAAERGRRWFVANDDLVGISAAEVGLAAVAFSELDQAAARAHLEAAVAVHANLGSSHQEAWALAVLAALCAEEEEQPAGRRWLGQAQERFQRLGAKAGSAYCLALERDKGLQSGD